MNTESVSDTAILTASSRAQFERLSSDPYAQYWIAHKDPAFYKKYINAAPPWEAQLICLRNRFFLQEGSDFFSFFTTTQKKTNQGIIVLLGAGFSSLSYLMPNSILGIELDYDDQQISKKIATERQLREKDLISEEKIVRHLRIDLSKPLPQCTSLLSESELQAPIYFVLEGLLYYLSNAEIMRLFKWLQNFPNPAAKISMTYWKPDMYRNPFLIEYKNFLMNHGMSTRISYLTTEEISAQLSKYMTTQETDYLQLAEKFQLEPRFTKNEEIFGESFLTLIKKPA